MDLSSSVREKDIFKRFLIQLIISKSFEKGSFFDIDQVKDDFEKIKVTYTPILNIPFRGANYDGVRIVFHKPFKKNSGLYESKITFIFPFALGTSKTIDSNISRLMSSFGCSSFVKNYILIRTQLEELSAGRKCQVFSEGSSSRKSTIDISTPMFRDMANGHLVYQKGPIVIKGG